MTHEYVYTITITLLFSSLSDKQTDKRRCIIIEQASERYIQILLFRIEAFSVLQGDIGGTLACCLLAWMNRWKEY